jgi:hypothetical protein
MILRSRRAQASAPAGSIRPGFVVCVQLLVAGCLAASLVVPARALASGKRGEIGLGVYFGGGRYDNRDFNADLEAIGYGRIESGIEYGFAVDYRLSDWLSLSGGAARIGGDSTPPNGPADPTTTVTYGVRGSPLILGLIVHPARTRHANVDVFAGVGPLLNATVSSSSGQFDLEGRKTGFYAHGGVAGEYRFSPMVAMTLSGLVRHAQARNVDLRDTTGDPSAIWDLDFNGFAVWFGPKLYFGSPE